MTPPLPTAVVRGPLFRDLHCDLPGGAVGLKCVPPMESTGSVCPKGFCVRRSSPRGSYGVIIAPRPLLWDLSAFPNATRIGTVVDIRFGGGERRSTYMRTLKSQRSIQSRGTLGGHRHSTLTGCVNVRPSGRVPPPHPPPLKRNAKPISSICLQRLCTPPSLRR